MKSVIHICLFIQVITHCIIFSGCNRYGEKIEQVDISKVEKMANFPQPYKIIDWHQRAIDFDAYVFDFNSTLPAGSVIWLDDAQRNLPQTTFGIYTAVSDDRQGPDKNNGECHESLNSLHCIIGAGLNGIDKTDQDGYNYVKMVQNYFNTENGWNIVMNSTCPDVSGNRRDWWYDVYPNILYYAVCDIFPGVEYSDFIQRTVAEQFVKADSVLNGNYDHSYFDYSAMKGRENQIPFQQDAAGGHGWVLYAAYRKYGEDRYLKYAKSAIDALASQTESRFYEILLPMGIYTAARLNAEQGCDYDIARMLDWVFDGCTNPVNSRTGWGVTAGKWGEYEISGLQGCINPGDEYAFLMNSIDLAWPFVPLVKYQPQYARAIGKWMLNNTNACRLFYPDQIPDDHQLLPGMQSYTNSVIAYEGLRNEIDGFYLTPQRQAEFNLASDIRDKHPIAIGDGPKWLPTNPKETLFSIYSSSAVGILGAIVDTTDVEGILRLDCNATDFYASKPYPVYLMFNPFDTVKSATYKTGEGCKDIFDIVSKSYLARDVDGQAEIKVPADGAVISVELPAGSRIVKEDDGSLTVDGNVIAY